MDAALDPRIEQKIRQSFDRQAMMASLGARLVSVAAGRVEIGAAPGDGFGQQHGFVHAGALFALGDSAAGYAALSLMPLAAEVLTAEMKINLLAPARGALSAQGRVLKAGRRLVIVAADVWAAHDGKRMHVAALQGTMVPVDGSA